MGVLRPVGQSLWAACRSLGEGGHASAGSAEDTTGTTAVKPWDSTRVEIGGLAKKY